MEQVLEMQPLLGKSCRPWMRLVAYMSFWTGLSLYNISQSIAFRLLDGRPLQLGYVVTWGVADWYTWAAITPVIYYVCRRFPLEPGVWLKHIWLHVVVGVISVVAVFGVMIPIMFLCDTSGVESWSHVRKWVLGESHFYFWVYGGIVGLCHAWLYYRKYRQRELQTAELEKRLAQARLQVLKMQLDPHFLFNTLHAISALIHRDPEAAEAMLARLGEMLRQTLDRVDSQEIPLEDELDFVDAYLEIQQIRLGDRLAVTREVDPQTLEVLVPNLLLQPLVENAIRHGIEPLPEGGRLSMRAFRDGVRLWIEIRDNGRGLLRKASQPSVRNGVGLANTQTRLRYLYGDDHHFEASNAAQGGTVIRVGIPWRVCSDSQLEPTSHGEHSDTDRG